jgi:hypothetical protein
MSVHLSSSADYGALLDDYDTWLFDCDGVLWRGDQVVDGVVQVLHILRKRGMYMFTSLFFIPPFLIHISSHVPFFFFFFRKEDDIRYQ